MLCKWERRIAELKKEREKIEKEYAKKLADIDRDIKKIDAYIRMSQKGLHVGTITNALRFITPENMNEFGSGDCIKAIDELKAVILNNPERLKTEYIGCKDYAQFVQQCEWHQYGCGPRHGHMVWTIRATEAWRKGEIEPNDKDLDDIMYLLNLYIGSNDIMCLVNLYIDTKH